MGSLDLSGLSFDGPVVTKSFRGILFDFDGTIIDSTDAIVKHWHKIGKELGVDPNVILETSHGRRSIDTLKLYDESKANWEYVSYIEGQIPLEYGHDAVEIPGARKVLDSLESAQVPWTIVTSGTEALAGGWIKVMNLARPKHMVVAEDVSNGKPDPECYLLGRDRLGLDKSVNDILVVEDAPAGVRAGKAAGFTVLGLATTHNVQRIKDAGADFIVKDLQSLVLKKWDPETKVAELEIKDTLTN